MAQRVVVLELFVYLLNVSATSGKDYFGYVVIHITQLPTEEHNADMCGARHTHVHGSVNMSFTLCNVMA